MFIARDEKQHIAQLLSFFLAGEKVAFHIAAKQAAICEEHTVRSFLIKQSRQEKFHAAVFHSAILWLAPKGVPCLAKKPMQQYESLLNSAIDNNDLVSSIIGLQLILEGMGDVALAHFNHGINQRGVGYKKIRRAILAQENNHHSFGVNYLATHEITTHTTTQIDNYLPLIHDMFDSLNALFDFFDEDSCNYYAEFQRNLPVWMQHHALNHHPNL